MYDRVIINCTKLTVPLLAKLNTLVNEDGYHISVYTTWGSELPCPWDAWISIKDDDKGIELLCIEGGAGPNGFGYCQVVVPLKEAARYSINIDNFQHKLPAWVKELGY